ncbi:MAG: hypothetical protein KGH72_00330 [Candidatus Micrarchaeota archaeon]|nr:hypothetical protein [Candidatus Micrarchaeota archaeon]
MASKPLWYKLYFGAGIGILMGILIHAGTLPVNLSMIPNAINHTIAVLHLAGADAFYFTIIAILSFIGVFFIILHHVYRDLFDSSEYGLYVFAFGFFGGLVVAIALISVLSVIGIALLMIGVAICYRTEKEPPGSPEHRK